MDFTEVNRAVEGLVRQELQREIDGILDAFVADFELECKDSCPTEHIQAIECLKRLTEHYKTTRETQTIVITTPQKTRTSPILASHNTSHTLNIAALPPPLTSPSCRTIIKSGARKGQECGGKVSGNGESGSTCKRHQPRGTNSSGNGTCEALMKAGARKGQVCGAKVPNGETYCGKHKITKCQWKSPGDEKGNICGKSISRHSTSESQCRLHIIQELNLDTKSFVLHTNKFGNKEHKYSGLVFENKKVVGAQLPTGYITQHLNEEDFECVKSYGLPLSEPFIEKMKEYLKAKDGKKGVDRSDTNEKDESS